LIHHVIAPKKVEDEYQIAFDDMCDDYRQFCATLCGYAAHALGFELVEDGYYLRKADKVALHINSKEEGIFLKMKDIEPRVMDLPNGTEAPVLPGMTEYRIHFDGKKLTWPNDISYSEIDVYKNSHAEYDMPCVGISMLLISEVTKSTLNLK
jgi:hypothetical protein